MPTMKAFLQAEEAEREERKRLESQREAEWKKEEERQKSMATKFSSLILKTKTFQISPNKLG